MATVEVCGARHTIWQCKTCGVWATCPETVYEQHRVEGGYHCCPNGHQWGWSTEASEQARIRRERDRLKQDTARLADEVRMAREREAAAERRVSAAKGQITKMKNRSATGHCPCCNRVFVDLLSHMKSKHADYEAEEIVLEDEALGEMA